VPDLGLPEDVLQRGDILEAVARHHAVVVVAGHDERAGLLLLRILPGQVHKYRHKYK
jgi:hypothetical protein